MLLIVGGARDTEARAAATVLDAHFLDARDLSRAGWDLPTAARGSGRIVAGGQLLEVAHIRGVLVRRMAVYPLELEHVVEADRTYVASEMTALLTWFLYSLPVDVLNRPRAGALCGPGWHAPQWRTLAGELGFPLANASEHGSVEAVVIGEEILGDRSPLVRERARKLARAARVHWLAAVFDAEGGFQTAHTMPRLTGDVLAALAAHFRRRP